MRVLFATYADRTHFLPMVPLAWALRADGHDVRVATQPALVDTVVASGLTAVPVGRDNRLWQFLERRPEHFEATKAGPAAPYGAAELPEAELDLDRIRAGYADAVPWWHRMINDPMTEALVAFARQWRPDLVVWETNTYAAAVAATACGARHARLMWSIDYFGRTRELFLALQAAADPGADPLGEWLDRLVRPHGATFDERLVTGDVTIDHLPPSLRFPTALPVQPLRYVPYNGPAVVPDWLREPAHRPRVGLTLGISGVAQFGGYPVAVAEILATLAELDVEIVATLPDSERVKLRAVPHGVRIVPFVSLHDLAPTCAVMVHHTGPGTLCTTAVHGVPHVLLPQQYDEPYLAARVAEQGAGIAVAAARASGPVVRDAVAAVLGDPGFAAGAATLRDQLLAQPSPAEVAALLAA